MAMQDGFEWLARQNFNGETLRVLMHVMAKLDFENYILVKQLDVAIALGMQKLTCPGRCGFCLKKALFTPGRTWDR